MEIFKDIPGYEGKYQVSKTGKIKSLGNNRTKKEKLLKANFNARGYLTVALFLNGQGKTYTVHQLVAITFLNHTLRGYNFVVDHIDDNKSNNNVDNLQIVTQRENVSKKFGKNTGIKKQGLFWNVNLSFFSFDTKEEAYLFREKMLKFAKKLQK
jgi:hypothetical protein